MTEKKTLKIAGRSITLKSGTWYRASRPMASRGVKVFPVTITEMDSGKEAMKIEGLSYDEANEMINAFNNRSMSFDGRCW